MQEALSWATEIFPIGGHGGVGVGRRVDNDSDPEEYEWSTDLGTHCTQYVQLAFMSACLSIFLGGIIVILLARVLRHMFSCFESNKILKVCTPLGSRKVVRVVWRAFLR